jgi:hypothetical protein
LVLAGKNWFWLVKIGSVWKKLVLASKNWFCLEKIGSGWKKLFTICLIK